MRVDERTAELVETHKRLVQQERIAALGRAAAQVAHEVKNPLTGILLYSLHLKSKIEKTSENEAALVDKIVGTINHLIGTVDHILSFARPVTLTPRPANLNQIVNDILELLRPQITTNKIEVRLSLRDEESLMRGALMNLMLNAIEAMPNGGTLNVKSERTDEMLRLEITDTGRGIGEEEAKNIFEPFYTTKKQGLGLGMPYAKKIVEQHGGAISLNSRVGEGTTISITLPASQKEVAHAS
jgi:signal transduction histidine kinase